MTPHVELESTRHWTAALGRSIWSWEISVYLFLGGLAAGLMIAFAIAILLRGRERISEGLRNGILLAPLFVSLGMTALLVDLSYKRHIFRFYTTWQPASPMSFGAWVLLLVFPLQAALILAVPPAWASRLLARSRPGRAVVRVGVVLQSRLSFVALAALGVGLALGTYTGVLLSTSVARPLWSSGALGPLFLVSGVSTAVALLMLLEAEPSLHALLARCDVALMTAELLLLALWLVALLSAGPVYREAAGLLLWGPYAPAFLGFVVFGGLLVPATLGALVLLGKARDSRALPVLVLAGGLLLRFVVVAAGQATAFVQI